ncbi:MAG: Protease prsW [Parcubacteria group bacterium Athens0714_16]|nr:MAG: Protease prsW [Parcubacteria group bacterium Athens0714_16]
MNFQTITIALVGGIIPALFWLWFWLREDKRKPEPKGLIALTFLGGFVAVLLALFAEKFVKEYVLVSASIMIILWSAIEEIFKYVASYFTSLRKHDMDEPVDAMVYLITTALGFAALENVLFLISETGILEGIVAGNMRFMGATVLHTLTSGVVGLFIGLSFYKSALTKKIYLLIGLILSIALHSIFNLLIINGEDENIFMVFGLVWFAVIVLILLFEKVKRIRPQNINQKNRLL